MKAHLPILLAALLAGCADRPTLEELEDEALMTGDWSAVEARERELRAREEVSGGLCPTGYTRVCIEQGMVADCNCLKGTASPPNDYDDRPE